MTEPTDHSKTILGSDYPRPDLPTANATEQWVLDNTPDQVRKAEGMIE